MSFKAALYTPYADTLGGGERYFLSLAQVLLDLDWQVDVSLSKSILDQARTRFNLPLKDIVLVRPDYLDGPAKLVHQSKYDLLFWVSDGSIPTMMAKKNWLHFQVPFHNKNGQSLFNRMKLKTINKVICNSVFTKTIIDQEYGVGADVWYPPVAIEDFSPGKKTNSIIAVGRFENTMNVKRQDILVSAFKELVDQGFLGWRLVLAGGSQSLPEKNVFLQQLEKSAQGYPIEFLVNTPFTNLKKAYSQAKIFWHAAGFGYNEMTQPEKMEHFGMTTVEAMASGCWPLVYEAGGQKEILANFDNKSMCLWQTEEELIEKTKKLIKKIPPTDSLIELTNHFSYQEFKKNVEKNI